MFVGNRLNSYPGSVTRPVAHAHLDHGPLPSPDDYFYYYVWPGVEAADIGTKPLSELQALAMSDSVHAFANMSSQMVLATFWDTAAVTASLELPSTLFHGSTVLVSQPCFVVLQPTPGEAVTVTVAVPSNATSVTVVLTQVSGTVATAASSILNCLLSPSLQVTPRRPSAACVARQGGGLTVVFDPLPSGTRAGQSASIVC